MCVGQGMGFRVHVDTGRGVSNGRGCRREGWVPVFTWTRGGGE